MLEKIHSLVVLVLIGFTFIGVHVRFHCATTIPIPPNRQLSARLEPKTKNRLKKEEKQLPFCTGKTELKLTFASIGNSFWKHPGSTLTGAFGVSNYRLTYES